MFDEISNVEQVISPTRVLSFAAKWHGSPEVAFHKATRGEGGEFDRMIRRAHVLLSEADAVCHFNGMAFDIPRLNQEFLRLGLPPPQPTPQIDLKRVVKQKFDLTSNKLAFVAPYFGLGTKVKHDGWELWKGCLAGDAKSWETMQKYNIEDVVLLERLYTKLLPWIDQHPNLNLYLDEESPVCPSCGSTKLQRRGIQRGTTLAYRRWNCSRCGKWSRSRTRDRTEPSAEIR